MRAVLLAVLLLTPVLAGAYHYGPGQERLELDEAQRQLSAARQKMQREQYVAAVDRFTDALAKLPPERQAEAARIRIERAKAMLNAQQLPEAYDDLTLLVDELQEQPESDPALLADARESLANAKYYLTWLMRLEGEPRPAWEPEIEAARQSYRLLAEQAEAGGQRQQALRHREDLEATIRLARMDLAQLQSLPLPSQCKGCCSGECACKGKGKKPGQGKGKTQKKPEGDKPARGASSGPPPDDGGN
jgi:hypothetical protein